MIKIGRLFLQDIDKLSKEGGFCEFTDKVAPMHLINLYICFLQLMDFKTYSKALYFFQILSIVNAKNLEEEAC